MAARMQLCARWQHSITTLGAVDMLSCCCIASCALSALAPADSTCKRCLARKRMQGKYLDQIADLYDGFSVVKTPLLNDEVRGSAKLRAFGQFLTDEAYSLASVLPAVLCTEGPAGVSAPGASGGAGSA